MQTSVPQSNPASGLTGSIFLTAVFFAVICALLISPGFAYKIISGNFAGGNSPETVSILKALR